MLSPVHQVMSLVRIGECLVAVELTFVYKIFCDPEVVVEKPCGTHAFSGKLCLDVCLIFL